MEGGGAKKKEAGASKNGGRPVDQVAYVKIWTEFVEKERELQREQDKHPRGFRVNPRGITVIPPKVNHFNPLKVSDEAHPSSEQREKFNKWREEMEHNRKGPREKFYFTQTESQEIGWSSHRRDLKHGRSKGKWRFGREKCDIVSYADSYTLAMGRNPYTSHDNNNSSKHGSSKKLPGVKAK